MTTEELAELTPEQKQSRIAELHGWTEIKGRFGRAPDGSGVNYIPDYYNDLNASHEMEKTMDEQQRWNHGTTIALTALTPEQAYFEHDGEPRLNGLGHFALAHATATQRADAFLLVMG